MTRIFILFFAALLPLSAQEVRFLLDSTQQQPANSSRALGSGTAVLDEEAGSLSLTLRHNVAGAKEVRVHEAPFNEIGPMIYRFETARSIERAVVSLSPDQIEAFKAGQMYLAVTSESLPDGEIRGQLVHHAEDLRRFVTITNRTNGQTFSPPVVLSHKKEFELFSTGAQAPAYMAQLAEDGVNGALLTMAEANPDILTHVVAGGPLAPGESITLAIDVKPPFDRITVVGMLTTTNDGFFAVKGMKAPTPVTRIGSRFRFLDEPNVSARAEAHVYDSGTETNTELCAHIPGSPCNSFNRRDITRDEGYVYFHPGIHGNGDLDPAVFGWRDAAATVSVDTAPPDLKKLTMELNLDTVVDGAFAIQEPSMCEAGTAQLTFTYSKAANVVYAVLAMKGLPYKLDVVRDDADPDQLPLSIESNDYNLHPAVVNDGVWQFWITGFFNNKNSVFWFGQDNKLIGNEFVVDRRDLPAGAIGVSVPVLHCIGSPLFEGTPEGNANIRFVYDYDRMLDRRGTSGFFFAGLPYDLNNAAEIEIYFTNGGLPAEMAFSFDDCLALPELPNGWFISTTLENFPKLDYLVSRPNRMPGFKGTLPPTPLSDLWQTEGCKTRVIDLNR